MSRITLIAILGLVLALPALTACGGGDDEASADELEQRITEAQQTAQSELEGLGEADSADSLRESAGQAADAIREQADALANVDAPEGLEAARDRFVDTLRALADRLEEQAETVDEGDVDRLLDRLGGLDSEDVEGVLQELRDAGLEIPTTDSP